MGKLTIAERNTLSSLFNKGGYVLNFSTARFDDFTYEIVGERLTEKYKLFKGASLDKFLSESDTSKAVPLIDGLLEYALSSDDSFELNNKNAVIKCREIILKYKTSNQAYSNNGDEGMIFISHRSTATDFVDAFVDFVKILGVPSDKIFCSSLPGNDVKYKIDSEVRRNLQLSCLNIIFLSSDYFNSAYCLNEEGIIWYAEKEMIVIALPEITEKNLIGFIDGNYKLRRLDDKSDIASIYDIIRPLYNLKNNTATINREIDKLISKYEGLLNSRVVKSMGTSSIEETLTADEAIVLYYIWRHKQRKIVISEIIDWLRDNEMYEINVKNGFDLLSASQKGLTMNDTSFELEINVFRTLTAKAKNDIDNLTKLIMPHYRPSKKTLDELWNTTLPDPCKLFIAYICDNQKYVFGCRWMGELEIEDIKQWETNNSLDSLLSTNYANCLQFFLDYKFIFPCEYTSHGNPRQYQLHKSLKEFLFSEDFPYNDDLAKIKEKHNNGLPF